MELSSFTTRTGDEIVPHKVESGTWRLTLGSAGSITCRFPLAWSQAMGMDVWAETSPVKRSLLLEFGDFVVEAGPIWRRRPDRETRQLTVSARGLRVWAGHRSVGPAAVQTMDESRFFVVDPEDESGWIPNPALATSWSGIDGGTAMQRLILQALTWAGGSLPIVPDAERPGSSQGVIDAAAQRRLSDALDDLEDLGPDLRLTPRRTVDRERIEWVIETGSEAQPMLGDPATAHVYTLGLPDVQITALDVDEDASGLASIAWSIGGRSGDRTLIAREASYRLTNDGFPLLERFDSAHSSLDDLAQLRGHARYELALGSAPQQSWRFSVPINQVPRLGDFREGHFVLIETDGLPATVARHAFPLPEGKYLMRILEIDGEFGSDRATLTCSPGRRVE